MIEMAILLEEMGRAATPAPYLPTILAGCAIQELGSDIQKNRWLPAIALGDATATIAFADVDIDWGPDAIQTRAARRENGWALTGQKRFVPWAAASDIVLVPARTADGLSLFL